MSTFGLAVECYSGHTFAQEPRAVIWQGCRYPIVLVEQRWRTPEGPSFRVRAEAGELFELSYLELEDRWAILALSSEGRASAGAGSETQPGKLAADQPQAHDNHNGGQGGFSVP